MTTKWTLDLEPEVAERLRRLAAAENVSAADMVGALVAAELVRREVRAAMEEARLPDFDSRRRPIEPA